MGPIHSLCDTANGKRVSPPLSLFKKHHQPPMGGRLFPLLETAYLLFFHLSPYHSVEADWRHLSAIQPPTQRPKNMTRPSTFDTFFIVLTQTHFLGAFTLNTFNHFCHFSPHFTLDGLFVTTSDLASRTRGLSWERETQIQPRVSQKYSFHKGLLRKPTQRNL